MRNIQVQASRAAAAWAEGAHMGLCIKPALESGMLLCLHRDWLGEVKEMEIWRLLLHLSSGLLCPASQGVWDQLPSTQSMSFIQNPLASGARHLGLHGWCWQGCGCHQALCSPRAALLASRSWEMVPGQDGAFFLSARSQDGNAA